ncbi:hypothetical protein FA13DRAFT_1791786 [Coprinellus micaceus]|uniref:DUF6533 domain-containing protein n=1 Tax=Coprinellus micaceus TaxID=71717 RepID=A0A4Y7TAW2_COPMI|nr:hypothetical protein FA13DRAFT_1791786 [Coprinellus micaceus]
MEPVPVDPAHFAKTAHHLMASKMYSLASCVMLFYDIALTMPDEVEKIWMQPRFTYMTLLWTLNRYVAPLGYMVIIASFHMDWPPETCDRYILYPEALKIVITLVIGIIFILRLYAIYGKSTVVAVVGMVLLVAELCIKIWAFTDGARLDLPEGLVGCILVGRNHLRFSFTWISELIFDTIVFLLTFHRTLRHYRFQHRSGQPGSRRPHTLIHLIMKDGVTYFAVIFAANAITASIFLWSPEPGIKPINASFSTLITSLMVSRLILNLKSAAQTASVWASGGRVSGVSQSDDDEAPYRHHHRQTYVVSDVPEDDISKEAEGGRAEGFMGDEAGDWQDLFFELVEKVE